MILFVRAVEGLDFVASTGSREGTGKKAKEKEEDGVKIDQEMREYTDKKIMKSLKEAPKGMLAIRVLKMDPIMWPTFFNKNAFQI